MYGSCSHRFCPTCGSAATSRWADKVLHNVLNIKHHHVVVTLPAWLRGIAKRNETAVYDAMFASVHEVIPGWFRHKHQMEGGMIAVLHTGGSDLKYHPHLHLVVTGGGIKGCSASAQVVLEVRRIIDVFVPNAIAPRSDNEANSRLLPFFGPAVRQVRSFQIYDRWGALCHQTGTGLPNDVALSWDGRQNQRVVPGVYVWTLEVELVDGSVERYSGDVTVVE
jgi:hypothetical protein